MVESASITALIIDIVICIGLPIGCLVYMLIKRQRPFIPFFVGITVYIVFQLILRVTIIGLIASMDWYKSMENNPWLYGLFVGITAGLFAEIGRYAGYKLMLKNKDRFADGISFGTGYAGFESIVIGGLNYISTLAFANLINSGQISQITAMSDSQTANQLVSNLTTTMPFDIYLGGIERIFIFIIHIALSLLVLLAVRKRKLSYLGYAVLAHLLVDGLPVAVDFSNLLLVVYTGVLAVISVAYIVLCKKQFSPPMNMPSATIIEMP